jgi:histidyl-tRNA synthetase
VILGDEQVEGQVAVRDLKAGTQRTVDVKDLGRELLRSVKQHRHGVGEG